MDWLTKKIHFLCQNKIHIVVLEELDKKENTIFLSEWTIFSKEAYPKICKIYCLARII